MKITNKENNEISIDELTEKLHKKVKDCDYDSINIIYLNKKTNIGKISLPTATFALPPGEWTDEEGIFLGAHTLIDPLFYFTGKALDKVNGLTHAAKSTYIGAFADSDFKISTEINVKELNSSNVEGLLNSHLHSFEKQYDVIYKIHKEIDGRNTYLSANGDVFIKQAELDDIFNKISCTNKYSSSDEIKDEYRKLSGLDLSNALKINDDISSHTKNMFDKKDSAEHDISLLLDIAQLAKGIALGIKEDRTKVLGSVLNNIYREKLAVLNSIYEKKY